MAKGGGASRPHLRLLPTVLLTAAILAVPAAVYGWGRNSSSFAIRGITVTGTELVREARVLKLLRQDYLGHNLFTVTQADVRGTLKPIALVAGATIDRDFPETLHVHVIEYKPAAYVLAGGAWYLVSVGGHVVTAASPEAASGAAGADASPTPAPSASASAPATTESPTPSAATTADGLPAPTGAAALLLAQLEAGPPHAALRLPRLASAAALRVGGTVGDRSVAASLPVIAGLSAPLRRQLAVVEAGRGTQLTLRFAGGPTVLWGTPQRSQAKTLALRAVLARYRLAGKHCVFVDVSTPDLVLARPVLK